MNRVKQFLIILVYTVVLEVICSCSSLFQDVEEKEYTKDVPEAVRQAFQFRHGKTDGIYFKILEASETTFEVEFLEDGKKRTESFLVNGNLVEEEVELDISEIPEKIRELILTDIRTRYDSASIFSLQSVAAREAHFYEFKIKTSKSKTGVMETYYDASGIWKRETPFITKPIKNLN